MISKLRLANFFSFFLSFFAKFHTNMVHLCCHRKFFHSLVIRFYALLVILLVFELPLVFCKNIFRFKALRCISFNRLFWNLKSFETRSNILRSGWTVWQLRCLYAWCYWLDWVVFSPNISLWENLLFIINLSHRCINGDIMGL